MDFISTESTGFIGSVLSKSIFADSLFSKTIFWSFDIKMLCPVSKFCIFALHSFVHITLTCRYYFISKYTGFFSTP